MATIIDSYTTDNAQEVNVTSARSEGQTFTATASYTIGGVYLELGYTVLSDGDLLVVGIYATGGDDLPTGDALCSGSIDSSTFVASPLTNWEYISLGAGTALTSGVKYAICCSTTTGEAGNIRWRNNSTGGYTGGSRIYDDTPGGVWDGEVAHDLMFKTVYGGPFAEGDGPGAAAPVDKTYSKELIAIGNGEVWREAVAGTMSEIAAATGLDTTDVLNAAEISQKLFIVNGTIKKVLDLVNVKITTADIDPGGAADGPPDHGAILTGGDSGAKMIVDYITAIDGACAVYGKRTTTATFTDTEVVTGTNASTSPYYDTAGGISFTLNANEVAGPHWYDYTVYGADATNKGVIPDTIYGICRYRGRAQLTRDPNYPHQWYQSRQLDPFDFLYTAGDAQSPVAGNNADCTEVGDIVVVAIPYSDDFLIYGCANELWVMSGDAAFGGELNPIDTTTGILGDRAWCWDDKGNLYIAGTAGLLRIPKGFGQIENLTRELWPDFVSDLAFDASLHRITLAFNPEEFGIHIFKTVLSTGACTGWWYDLRTEGLFPDAIPTAMGIYSATYYQTENPSYRKLLVGCADGYIKSFDRATKDDDSTAITSYVGFAPLALSTHSRKDGIIKNIDVITGIGDTDSNNVTCTVHIARTAAQVIKKLDDGDTAAMTKVFTAPNWTKSNLDRRTIRGQWAAIVLTNSTAAQSWSMERLIVDSKEVGRSL